jgi:hypothetical protein
MTSDKVTTSVTLTKSWLGAAAVLLWACAPELSPPAWLVDSPRILAVVGDAPEVSPGAATTFRALAVDANGPLDLSDARWSLCATSLALTDSGSVSRKCLGDLASAGQGATAHVSMSSNACSLFGPLSSPGSQRPHAADSTGGYYQPVRFSLGGALAFAGERLLCPLAQASFQVALDYRESYLANSNPVIETFTAINVRDPSRSLDAVPAGAQLALSLQWTSASNQTFPVLDPVNLVLVPQTEAMRVSWFVTAGALEQAQSGPDASGVASANGWTAPKRAGPVYLWAVLRDSRGGASWISLQADVVEPE